MKPKNAATPQPNTDPPLYAAGYHLTPGRLAMQRVRAYLAALLGLSLLALAILIAIETRQPLVILPGVALLGACAIYTVSVWKDVDNVRRQLWMLEARTGQDIDGDGHIGPPAIPEPVGHVVAVRSNGQAAREFTLPDLDPPREARPLIRFPQQPAVTANDVIWIIQRAETDGLSFRPWSKVRLPSGARIDRDLWRGILDGLIAWQFAIAGQTADGRRTVALRTDIDTDAMIHAIRQGAASPSAPSPSPNGRGPG